MDKRKPPADDRAGLGRKSSLIGSSGDGLQKGESVAICFIYPNESRLGPRAGEAKERKNGLGVAEPRAVVDEIADRARRARPALTGSRPFLDREAHPVAAGGDRIRILHPERLAHEIIDEVELGPFEHFERDGVDQHRRAVARHRRVKWRRPGPIAGEASQVNNPSLSKTPRTLSKAAETRPLGNLI